MKRLSLGLLILVCCAFIGDSIRWEWRGKPIVELKGDGGTLQFGLRSDGVVVWREITASTNSPAETQLPWGNLLIATNSLFYTNIVLTNFSYIPLIDKQ